MLTCNNSKVGRLSALVVASFDAPKGKDAAQLVPNCAILLIAHIAFITWVFKWILVKLAAALIDEKLGWSVSSLVIATKLVVKLFIVGCHAMSVLAGRNANLVLLLQAHLLLFVIFDPSEFIRTLKEEIGGRMTTCQHAIFTPLLNLFASVLLFHGLVKLAIVALSLNVLTARKSMV